MYYIKYGIFLVVLPVAFGPLLGEFSAKAEREYQTCVVQDTTYAVVVDYSDRVLVQQATEENGVLTIDTSRYFYFDKNDLILRYSKYEGVTIGLDDEIEKTSVFGDLWIKIKGVLSMPTITDWLMVIITLVYVVATIRICKANIKSAEASKEQLTAAKDQLEEAKREHEETIRLGCMPFLQFEIPATTEKPEFELELPLCNTDVVETVYCTACVKNVGNGTATNLTYTWKYAANEITENDYPPINAIMKEDSYYVQLTCDADAKIEKHNTAVLVLHYNDLLGNEYEQKIILYFEDYMLVRFDNDAPQFLGKVYYQAVTKE